jgi:cyclic pyranopterin phosphate synthase
MDSIRFWKILRVLTSNYCNYRCEFCHNEGQRALPSKQLLEFDFFRVILDSLVDTSLKEVHFSGGEPFTNPNTLKMIQYANDYTDLDIGCATNASLLSEVMIMQLSKTRVKLNIQFPSIRQEEFIRITKNGCWNILYKKLDLLKQYNVKFGLNHVITEQNIKQVFSVIDFAINNGFSLKLLPDLNDIHFVQYKDEIFSFLNKIAEIRIDKGTGAIKWIRKKPNESYIQVMYIDHPCYSNNFDVCKSFAEIRLLPNLELQPCIMNGATIKFDCQMRGENKELVKLKFQEAWKIFISC